MSERYVLVTGCGPGGIGEALVLEFQRRGLTVIATLLPDEAREELELNDIICLDLDVTSAESVQMLRKTVDKLTGGRLDVLVNNAGICYTMTAIDTDVKKVQAMFDVNVFGPMRMVHEFHPLLVKAQGTIVNIGSVGGLVPYTYGSSYNASKAALHHWGDTVRVEMAPLDVKVLTIISGNIGTNILKHDAHRTLPPNSYYSPLASEFQEHVRRKPKTTHRSTYAKNVVSQCLKTSPPAWFWFGETTTLVRLVDTIGFRTLWDIILWPVFNLGKLRRERRVRIAEEA